jgi:hypothetical protein
MTNMSRFTTMLLVSLQKNRIIKFWSLSDSETQVENF